MDPSKKSAGSFIPLHGLNSSLSPAQVFEVSKDSIKNGAKTRTRHALRKRPERIVGPTIRYQLLVYARTFKFNPLDQPPHWLQSLLQALPTMRLRGASGRRRAEKSTACVWIDDRHHWRALLGCGEDGSTTCKFFERTSREDA